MGKTRKELVYKKIREIAKEQDCNQKFLDDFDACYTFLYESINDLPVMKQILITIKAMTIGTKAATNQINRMICQVVKPRLLL